MASCQAVLLAEILAAVDNATVSPDSWDCPGDADYVVTIERPDRGIHIVIDVCAGHELLIAEETVGYDRSIRKHSATT